MPGAPRQHGGLSLAEPRSSCLITTVTLVNARPVTSSHFALMTRFVTEDVPACSHGAAGFDGPAPRSVAGSPAVTTGLRVLREQV